MFWNGCWSKDGSAVVSELFCLWRVTWRVDLISQRSQRYMGKVPRLCYHQTLSLLSSASSQLPKKVQTKGNLPVMSRGTIQILSIRPLRAWECVNEFRKDAGSDAITCSFLKHLDFTLMNMGWDRCWTCKPSLGSLKSGSVNFLGVVGPISTFNFRALP